MPLNRTPARLCRSPGGDGTILVLQLRLIAWLSSIVGLGGGGLVLPSPEGPCEDKQVGHFGREERPGEKHSDFRYAGNEFLQSFQATACAIGLVSFGLAVAARLRSAANLARKAAAAMTSVIWRCQPCQERASQWSRPRSSLPR